MSEIKVGNALQCVHTQQYEKAGYAGEMFIGCMDCFLKIKRVEQSKGFLIGVASIVGGYGLSVVFRMLFLK